MPAEVSNRHNPDQAQRIESHLGQFLLKMNALAPQSYKTPLLAGSQTKINTAQGQIGKISRIFNDYPAPPELIDFTNTFPNIMENSEQVDQWLLQLLDMTLTDLFQPDGELQAWVFDFFGEAQIKTLLAVNGGEDREKINYQFVAAYICSLVSEPLMEKFGSQIKALGMEIDDETNLPQLGFTITDKINKFNLSFMLPETTAMPIQRRIEVTKKALTELPPPIPVRSNRFTDENYTDLFNYLQAANAFKEALETIPNTSDAANQFRDQCKEIQTTIDAVAYLDPNQLPTFTEYLKQGTNVINQSVALNEYRGSSAASCYTKAAGMLLLGLAVVGLSIFVGVISAGLLSPITVAGVHIGASAIVAGTAFSIAGATTTLAAASESLASKISMRRQIQKGSLISNRNTLFKDITDKCNTAVDQVVNAGADDVTGQLNAPEHGPDR